MTGYHIRPGYNGGHAADDEVWRMLKEAARKIADQPSAIIAEARRLGAPERCADGCELETFTDNYAQSFDTYGHPVRIIEDATNPQVMQLAACGCAVKFAVRRAYVRLLIEEMHRQGIEVNLVVA